MLMPYLAYQGNCEEAFNLYAAVFSGKIEGMSRYTPETGGAALAGRVMHAHLSLGEMGALNGADREKPVDHGDAISLIVHCKGRARAQEIAEGLARSGTILADFAPNPPPDDDSMCGVVRDKFGYTWIIVSPNEPAR